MIFLDTKDKMSFIDIENNYSIYLMEIANDDLDLPMSTFIRQIQERMEDLSAEEPTLIEVVVDSVSEDDVEYMKDLVVELIAESLTGEKLNKDWQPRTAISNMLNTTIKAQTTLLNYSIVPSVLNIVFTKEGQEVYNLIKK